MSRGLFCAQKVVEVRGFEPLTPCLLEQGFLVVPTTFAGFAHRYFGQGALPQN